MANTSEHISIRIDRLLLSMIDKEATRQKRSRSAFIEILLWVAAMDFDGDTPRPKSEPCAPILAEGAEPAYRFKITSSLNSEPQGLTEKAIPHAATCKCLICKPPKP